MIPSNTDNRTLYELAFLQAPIGMALTNLDGQWLQVNPALCRLLGYEETELVSLRFQSIVHPDDLADAERFMRQIREEQTGSNSSVEVRYMRKSGGEVRLLQYGSFLLDSQGHAAPRISVHFINITARNEPEPDHRQKVILEHAIDIITYCGPNGICEYVSPSVVHLLGYEPEELIGRHQFEIFHPEDMKIISSRQFEDTDKFSCRVRHKKGHYVWFETTLRMLRNEQGEVHTVIGVGRDITERTLKEQALIQSERKLAEAQKIACVGSWEWDIRADVTVWSEQFLRIFDVHSRQITSKKRLLPQFVHPEDKEKLIDSINKAMQGGAYNLECRIVTAKGQLKHVHIQGIVMFDEHKRPEKMLGTLQDITDRKKILHQLEEVVDRYSSLKKYSSDAIISLDLEGYITSANPASERISGYQTEELLGKHYTELVYHTDLAGAEERFRLLMQGEPNHCYEMRILHKDGSIIDLVLTPAPIIIRHELRGCYVLVKDVTEQKKKDEFLRNSEKLSVVGQLAAGVAHEIRNPLTALKGFIKLMINSDQHRPKYLAIMKDELERIELIVSELLMLSKPTAVHLRPVHLQEMVEEVSALIGTQAIMKNIAIEFSADDSGSLIYCDPNQIKQVIINFLKNSIEAMLHEGSIQVELTTDAFNEQTVLRITDQGCGIPEDQLRRLGEPFFTTKEGGTGLGLMVSQRIIEHHGGKLSISSRVNIGTTVEVRFPILKDGLVDHTAVGI